MRALPPAALVAVLSSFALAACGAAPTPRASAPVRAAGVKALTAVPAMAEGGLADGAGLERPFTLPTGGEVVADLRLAVPGGDWEVPGREAATIQLSLDGKPSQAVVLYAGEAEHTYQVALGELAAGPHVLKLERLAAFSAAALGRIELRGGAIGVVPPGAPGYDTLARAPIMISREKPHLTDTPLVMMVDESARPGGGKVARYTAVFSNEDGGTATPALMARWGRTADIDWCYAIELDAAGKPVRETYQGRLHFTKEFRGKYEGRHPILRVSTDNNCYDDEGEGPLRFRLAPMFQLDPAQTAREEVLDRHPWAYGVMGKELFRERKAQKDPQPGEAPTPPRDGAIGDPRRFLMVEFKQAHRGRGVAVAVTLKGVPGAFVSHRGDGDLTAKRTGWCRVAVELPRSVRLEDVAAIDLVGLGRGSTVVSGVRRVVALDAAFMPVQLPIQWAGEAVIDDDADRVRVFEAKP